MLFDLFLFRLVSNCCHDVRKDCKLVEVPHLYSKFKGLLNLLIIHLKDEGHSFERIANKLRKVIIKMVVNMVQVFFEVCSHFIEVEENLLKVLLDTGENSDQLNITQLGRDIVGD